MPDEYIALDRTFSPLYQYDDPVDIDETYFDWESVWESPETGGIGWQELTRKDKIVILAEAGTGKTEELKAISKQLYEQGRPAFFLRLELLLESDFQISNYLSAGELSRFQEWVDSGDDESIAYFFLDAVDEAKLQKPNALELILPRFENHIGFQNLKRTKIFMTSRFSEWRVKSDLGVFKERLISSVQQHSLDQRTLTIGAVGEMHEAEGSIDRISAMADYIDEAPAGSEESPSKIVYRLNPLDDEQIKSFVEQSSDFPDPEKFINKIYQADAISFAQRPQDLIDLIAYWQDNDQQLPEKHIELVKFNIDKKLSESDENRALQFPLSPEDACLGAQLLAAATTFCKRNTIRLPETEEDYEIRQSSIKVSAVIPKDWDVSKQRALTMRPIFDPEIYGTIRFHHRVVREFLTAQWLSEVLKCTPFARLSVHKFIFAKKYGHDVVIPSMQPIAAWLSCLDKGIRDKLAATAPEVLVEYGDPSVYPIKFQIKLLNTLVKHYQDKKRTDLKIKPPVLKRLASNDSKMIAVINKKLKQHSKNEDLCRLLLETVRQGKLEACSPVLVSLAMDQENSEMVRVIASRSIWELGEVLLQRQMVAALFEQGSEGRKIISWDCDYLFPEKITPAELVGIISDFPPQGRRSSYDLRYQLDMLAASANQWNRDIAADLITGIYGLIKQEPFVEELEYGVSANHVWLLEYAVQFANPLIEEQDAFCFDLVVLDIFWLFSQTKNDSVFYSKTRDMDLLDIARGWHEFAYRLFWHAVEASRSRNIPPLHWEYVFNYAYVIWQPLLSDWDQLIGELSGRQSESEKRVALTALYKIYVDSDGSSDEMLNDLRDVIGESSDLRLELEGWINPPARPISDEYLPNQNEWAINQNAREEQRRIYIEALRADPASFRELYTHEANSLHPAAKYLYSSLRNIHPNGSMQKSFGQWELLEPEFGSAVAEAFREGCIKLWRDFDPKSLRGWREENYDMIGYGLTGLAMESAHVPNWISYLSSAQATRAATYATREMNSFPCWISSLQQAFPEEVKAVFLEEVSYELFETDSSYSRNLDLLRVKSEGFDESVFIPDLVELLEATDKAHNSDAAKRALNIIIENEPPPETKEQTQKRLSRIAARFYHNNEASQEKLFWLHVLFAVDADEALRLLNESVAQSGQDPRQKEEWVNSVFAQFSHEGRHRIFSNYFQDYTKIEILKKLVPLAHSMIDEEDDIRRESGPYTPTDRDDAQRVRFQLLDRVAKMPGEQSHDLLVQWAGESLFYTSKDWLLNQAKRRAEEDSEFEAWKEEEVLAFTEKHNDYKDKKVHKLAKLVFDHPRTSTIAGVIGAIATVAALFGSTPPSPTQSNTNNFYGNVTNTTIQQSNNKPSEMDIESILRDSNKKPKSTEELKKRLLTYEGIVESNPKDIEAYNYIGRIQMSVDNPYAAIEAFGKVLSIAEKEGPKDWQGIAYSNLGLAHQKRNNLEVACANWKKSLISLDTKKSAERIQAVQQLLEESCLK